MADETQNSFSGNPDDPLAPENVKVVFEGRPGKAFVSILDYLSLYESRQELLEVTEKSDSASRRE